MQIQWKLREEYLNKCVVGGAENGDKITLYNEIVDTMVQNRLSCSTGKVRLFMYECSIAY